MTSLVFSVGQSVSAYESAMSQLPGTFLRLRALEVQCAPQSAGTVTGESGREGLGGVGVL